jgi:hypothetical protein
LAEEALLSLGRRDSIRQRWLNRVNCAARWAEIPPFMDGHQLSAIPIVNNIDYRGSIQALGNQQWKGRNDTIKRAATQRWN